MAITIDRTNYNALVDDDGTNTKGTPWSKNQVKIVLMDPIDVALAKLVPVTGGTNVVFGPGPGVQSPAAVAQFNISGTAPLVFQSTDAGAQANNKTWDVLAGPLSLTFRAVTDGYTGAGNWLVVTRTTGNAGIANVNLPENVSVGGVLTVAGYGTHQMSASGANGNVFIVQNTQAGAAAYAAINVGNNANSSLLQLLAYSSAYAGAAEAFNAPNSSSVVGLGAGGLTLVANNGSLRFHTGTSFLERMRVDQASGAVLIGTTVPFSAPKLGIFGDLTVGNLQVLQNSNGGNSGNFTLFVNSANAACGTITQTGAASIVYSTSSDARLKIDQGRATNLEALRAVVVHDFRWKADDTWDRGVFAQEAQAVFPRAVVPGTDDTTESGALAKPWMTDYSKFVSDLIVGWQQHDAAIAQLRTELLALKG
jgi:hypothetical protein